jgi:hypothetical protein
VGRVKAGQGGGCGGRWSERATHETGTKRVAQSVSQSETKHFTISCLTLCRHQKAHTTHAVFAVDMALAFSHAGDVIWSISGHEVSQPDTDALERSYRRFLIDRKNNRLAIITSGARGGHRLLQVDFSSMIMRCAGCGTAVEQSLQRQSGGRASSVRGSARTILHQLTCNPPPLPVDGHTRPAA